MSADYGDSTRCAHAGYPDREPGRPLLPGPTFASIYPIDPAGPEPDLDTYGRPHNASRRQLEAALGELEGGQCLTFASGMAAVSAALFSTLGTGDSVLLPSDGYYTTRSFAEAYLRPRGVSISLAPTTGPYPDFAGFTLVLLETPANPRLDVCDIAALADAAHAAGALVAVDNTTATPLGQRPLDLGADLVVASGTKAISGHSDLLLGYVAGRDEALMTGVRAWRDSTGAIPGPFDAWLTHRSLATLDLRLSRQAANAAALVEVFAAHPAVRGARWPGRPTDPAYPVASRQMRRMPGLVTVEFAGAEEVRRFLSACRLVTPATSFGGVHTTADRRAQWGDDTPAGLLRFSCGVEDTADLVADVTAGLDAVLTAVI